ncbi:MAG: S8/S53 family peptidase [Anaeromyxobacter sp.]
MSAQWAVSWHHVRLGIPGLWRQELVGRDTGVALLDTGLAAPPGLDRKSFEYLDSAGGLIGPGDPEGHGTSCASVIAGYRGGALGIAPYTRIHSLRVLGPGTSTRDVEAAFGWALEQPEIDVVSCSFSMPVLSQRAAELVRALSAAGKVVVAAAGDAQVANPFPEGAPKTITVAAVDRDGKPLPGARTGAFIDVSAPGLDLPVVTPGGALGRFSESSAAAAVVSGVAALILSSRPRGPERQALALSLESLIKRTAWALGGGPQPAVTPGAAPGIIRPAALLAAAKELV